MSGDKLWLKLSSSINFFLKNDYDWNKSNNELLREYMDFVLDYNEESKSYRYLDKKTFKYIELDDETLERIKATFLERVANKREKLKPLEESVRKQKEPIKEVTVSKNNNSQSKNKRKMIKKSKRKNRK